MPFSSPWPNTAHTVVFSCTSESLNENVCLLYRLSRLMPASDPVSLYSARTSCTYQPASGMME